MASPTPNRLPPSPSARRSPSQNLQLPPLHEQLGEILDIPLDPRQNSQRSSQSTSSSGRDALLSYLDIAGRRINRPPDLRRIESHPPRLSDGVGASLSSSPPASASPRAGGSPPAAHQTQPSNHTQTDVEASEDDESDYLSSPAPDATPNPSFGGRRGPVPWEACRCAGVHTKHLRHWETSCPYNLNRTRFPCGVEGCRKSFARADGRKRHWDKFHPRHSTPAQEDADMDSPS